MMMSSRVLFILSGVGWPNKELALNSRKLKESSCGQNTAYHWLGIFFHGKSGIKDLSEPFKKSLQHVRRFLVFLWAARGKELWYHVGQELLIRLNSTHPRTSLWGKQLIVLYLNGLPVVLDYKPWRVKTDSCLLLVRAAWGGMSWGAEWRNEFLYPFVNSFLLTTTSAMPHPNFW